MATIFNPLRKQEPSKVLFNDQRLESRHRSLLYRMKSQQSSTIHQLASSYNESKAYYRFINNEDVNVEELMGANDARVKDRVAGKHILALGDTTEISLKGVVAHLQDAERVGYLSDNKTRGFLCHAQAYVDADSGNGLGLGSLLMWNRRADGAIEQPPSPSYEQRESYKWECLIRDSLSVSGHAQLTTHVFDREADIFDLFEGVEGLPGCHHLLVRSHYNRSIINEQSEESKLWDHMQATQSEYTYELEISAQSRRNESRRKQQQRTARKAVIQLRFGSVRLCAPSTHKDGSPTQKFCWVEALEQPDSVPATEEPIHWRLLTTHEVRDYDTAMQIVGWYEKRWFIEQLFRLIKRKGFNIEQCQLRSFGAILKMTVLCFQAAFDVLRLLLARDNPKAQPIQQVFTQDQIKCLSILNQALQGKTEKQRNRHPPNQLSWATWVIARLGGWKGLSSQSKAGPITIKEGLEKFAHYYEASKLFN